MEVGGSMGRSGSLAVVFLIMLLSNPSQVILGTYFFIFTYTTDSIYDYLFLNL